MLCSLFNQWILMLRRLLLLSHPCMWFSLSWFPKLRILCHHGVFNCACRVWLLKVSLATIALLVWQSQLSILNHWSIVVRLEDRSMDNTVLPDRDWILRRLASALAQTLFFGKCRQFWNWRVWSMPWRWESLPGRLFSRLVCRIMLINMACTTWMIVAPSWSDGLFD